MECPPRGTGAPPSLLRPCSVPPPSLLRPCSVPDFEMTMNSETHEWIELQPANAQSLVDSRLQAHHAAQFASAIGVSYLAPRSDDSHTNLSWDSKHQALTSRETRALSHGVRVALRPSDLTLLVLVNESVGQRIPLHGSTISQAELVLRSALKATGVDDRRLKLPQRDSLPSHPVSGGRAFDVSRPDEFTELAHWFSNAFSVLGDTQRELGSSEVRCWPHHFDIATLITVGPDASVGVGLSPGDVTYPEPYFYVNAWPSPKATQLPELYGNGSWNRDGWFGAVLPGSRLVAGPGQRSQVTAFQKSAVEACLTLVRHQGRGPGDTTPNPMP